MEQYIIYLWGFLAVFLVILEIAFVGILQIWFAIGAICAAIVAIFAPTNYLIQLLVFLIVSGFLTLVGSMLFKNKKGKEGKNPVFSIIGKEAMVTKDIDTLNGVGQIQVNGEYWSAKSNTDDIIKTDTRVKVLDIDGVKAVVEILK